MLRRNGNLNLEAYTDADYAGSMVDRRFTQGTAPFWEEISLLGETRNKMW